MPRKPLGKDKSYIQVILDTPDKEAFEAWCFHNQITMSEAIRKIINPQIKSGKRILADKIYENPSNKIVL